MKNKVAVFGLLLIAGALAAPTVAANGIIFDNVGVGLGMVDCAAGDCGAPYCGGVLGIVECGIHYGTVESNWLVCGDGSGGCV